MDMTLKGVSTTTLAPTPLAPPLAGQAYPRVRAQHAPPPSTPEQKEQPRDKYEKQLAHVITA